MARLMPHGVSRLSGLLFTVGAALLACSPADPAVPSDRDNTSRPPSEFTSRAIFPSCGSTAAKDAGFSVVDVLPDSAMDCLNRARAQRGAGFQSTTITTEGDPITTYYRVRPGTADVEVFVDKSRDPFSSNGWSHYTCTAIVVSAESLRRCGANR